MADICHFEGNNVFNELYSWPIALAAVYFKVQYLTRNIYATIAFAYLFETFLLVMNMLYHYLAARKDSPWSQFTCTYGLSWFAAPSGSFMCYESAVVSLIAAPVVAISAALLWHWGVEVLVGAPYKTPPVGVQHGILWSTLLAALLLGPNALFASSRRDLIRRTHITIVEDEVNVSLLFVALLCIAFSAYVPFRSAKDYGLRSAEYVHALRAYLIFSALFLFMVFFAALFRPALGGYRSSYMRILIALLILWFACVFVWLARTARNAYRRISQRRLRRPLL